MRQVTYNKQRDNHSFGGKDYGNCQCMTTSVWMLMSYYTPKIKGDDDKGLALYHDDVEIKVGKPGIAEKLVQQYNWITGKTSRWWLIQRDASTIWLNKMGVPGKTIFKEGGSWIELDEALYNGPVVLGTKKLGGLRGGHIILVIEKSGGQYICHDPFGDAMTNYENHDGSYIKYPEHYLRSHAVRPNFMYFSRELSHLR